ncbi:phosphoribosylamine--glycine ligase [Solidesulfovibrio carbinolicus]|uniref:Phosphoribosylamine--glycine ligase n=1 Tax=Solidesulfovibrio carbinolicus TaxID=296842 RepID=A0A4V0YQQ2_9BACT|nr:phosphoribosylamine--glycine ligase [Solidesulfovibrio carbinolicus]QAZ67092.1 phosphoribosylamine--glycine ligase [Solidesulfovibrio carbinolicus]
MRILVVGSGGREHALAHTLLKSPDVSAVITAPGNGGTATCGENVPLSDTDVPGIVALAKDRGMDLVVVGPEAPLVAGLRDALETAGVPCFGPDAYAAQLEGSKAFAKDVMTAAGVPTAAYASFTDAAKARAYAKDLGRPVVVKADGLAAGKGVTVCTQTDQAMAAIDEAMVDKAFGAAGGTVVVEEMLVGEEASFLAFCDGKTAVPMTACQDHKAVFDGDQGPNTGGMGAYCPAPVLPPARYAEMMELVIHPILREMAKRGHPFTGILYAGLMMTEAGPKVLEYNVRFGDPECQPLLMRLSSDLPAIMLACRAGKLTPELVRWSDKSALCVVMAAPGYPGSYPKGMPITGIEAAEAAGDGLVKVFQAGTKLVDGQVVTSGGRVLGVTALGDGLAQAKATAYRAVEKLHFDGAFCRRDIGDKGLKREEK